MSRPVPFLRPLVVIALTLALSGCVYAPGPAGNDSADGAPAEWRKPTTSAAPTPTPSETPPWYEGDWQPNATKTSSPSPSVTPTPTPTPTPTTAEWSHVFVLRYVARTLENHTGEFYGRHCGDAFVDGDRILLLDQDHQRFLREGADPLLVVLPGIEGNWATTGYGGFGMSMPANVSSEIQGHDRPFANVSWNASSEALSIDGTEVILPYSWNVTAEDGSWRIEAEIAAGPTRVDSFQREGCI